jgi:hypothetical protein
MGISTHSTLLKLGLNLWNIIICENIKRSSPTAAAQQSVSVSAVSS